MNILFIANREYLNHLKECIQSVIRFPAKDGYAIYILHSDLKKEDQLEFSILPGERGRKYSSFLYWYDNGWFL